MAMKKQIDFSQTLCTSVGKPTTDKLNILLIHFLIKHRPNELYKKMIEIERKKERKKERKNIIKMNKRKKKEK